MFDLQDDQLTKHKPDSPVDRMTFDAPKPDKAPDNELDSDENKQLHSRLMGYYRQELARQEVNRFEQSVDEDYYDHIQWTEEEAAKLSERGQAPIVYDIIHNTLNWITGSEKRGRTDFKILPRGKEDIKPAEGKTKYMKYLSDVNRTPFHRSAAFESAAKVGIGWLEVGYQDEDDGEPIYTRSESWRNMLWDSSSTELDGKDMRYQFRSRWVDEDIAKAIATGREDAIARSVVDGGVMGSFGDEDGDAAMDSIEEMLDTAGDMGSTKGEVSRKRVRLIESWYRRPENVKKLRGGAFNGQVYDKADPRHVESVESGQAKIVSKGMMVTRVALMTPTELLYDGPSPYKHNRFKFIPVWGHRRGRDGLPYGIVRGLRHIQDAINKRASKALWIMSTNKTYLEEGALPDDMTLDDFADENARPDATIMVKDLRKLLTNVDRSLGAEHLNQMQMDIGFAQTSSGVTDELMGRETNAASGVAVKARQEQGSVVTSKFFDNLRLAAQLEGELELSLIEQFVTEEKQFRITNQRGTPEFIVVNDGLPENDITRTKADFVISESDWRATYRQAQNDMLIEMMGKLPEQVAMVMFDLVVEGMDIENRDEMVKRIRAINGQRDPDAAELTPEEQQAMQAKAEQDALAKEQMMLQMREINAKVEKLEAEAARTKAETNKIGRDAIASSMAAAEAAMTAATMVATQPTIAAVGDKLLNQAGWKGAHVAGMGLPPAPAQPAPAPQPMQQPASPQDPGVMPVQPQ